MDDEHILILTLAHIGHTASSISIHTVNSKEACHAAGKAWTKGLRKMGIEFDSAFYTCTPNSKAITDSKEI